MIDEDDDIQDYVKPCPNCEYHKNRAALWRAEAYKHAGHDVIERPWIELTDHDIFETLKDLEHKPFRVIADAISTKLKEKNT